MFKNGFLKVCCATPYLEVGNVKKNVYETLKTLEKSKASVTVFPELGFTGYTAGDLFLQGSLVHDVYKYLEIFLEENTYKGIVVVGAPIEDKGSLYNCALVIKKDKILGVVPKKSLPNSKEFYEKRWFKSGNNNRSKTINILGEDYPFGNLMFSDYKNHIHFGVEICEDMWASVSPGNFFSVHGANMIINISASNETLGKQTIRRNAVLENSRKNCGAYIYVSAGANESTSDTVFSGHNIVAINGELLVETKHFSMDTELLYADIDVPAVNFKRRTNTSLHDSAALPYEFQEVRVQIEETHLFEFCKEFSKLPFVPQNNPEKAFSDISNIQEYALFKRLKHIGAKTLVIGVSGGLDSTLALLVAHATFKKLNKDPKDIIAVTMPGLGTSTRTKTNADVLMQKLGITVLTKPISDATYRHFETIGHDKNVLDVTYENVQARIRTLILMNLANEHKGIVLGTGDMSELALGWCTYNGDQMSMYGINAGIPKTLVKFMVEYYAKIKYQELKDTLFDIIDTPISPELTKNQVTEDSVGKYEINDFILYRYLTCGDDEERLFLLLKYVFNLDNTESRAYVENFFKRFFTQQFKRQALPDGPKILDVGLGSRSDYRMPSDIKRW